MASGMRASKGAIQKFSIDAAGFNVHYETIGHVKPRGICGSGYIDILAVLLKTGLVDKSGKIVDNNTRYVRKGDFGLEFIVVFKEETDIGRDIVFTEADIENLKRAKAAIYSATATLIRHMDLDFSQIKNIWIAGGFGAYLDIGHAIGIGLLPDLERSKILFIGNSSLAGARQTLLSYEATKTAHEIARKITYFELSVDAGYMDEYMAALFFPHTDLTKFPSVVK